MCEDAFWPWGFSLGLSNQTLSKICITQGSLSINGYIKMLFSLSLDHLTASYAPDF